MIPSTVLTAYSTWFHVVVMSGTDSFSLYVNGTLVASSTDAHSNTLKVNNQQRLTLTIGNPEHKLNNGTLYSLMCHFGQNTTRSDESMIRVDDLRFYSRQLKVKEIQALNNNDHLPTRFFFE
jgi:hypothetical protein